MFENYLTGNYHDGRMVNYSRGGMCFEADVAPTSVRNFSSELKARPILRSTMFFGPR